MTPIAALQELHLDLVHIYSGYYWQIEVEREHLRLRLKRRSRWTKRRLDYPTLQYDSVRHHGHLTQEVLNELAGRSAALWSAEVASIPELVRQLSELTSHPTKVVKG